MLTQPEIQPYLDDYRAVTGMVSNEFVCPITLRACKLDEVSNGHVVNETLAYPHNVTVPVYGKVDHFYGTRVEKGFIDYIKMTGTSGSHLMLMQRELNVKFREHGPTFRAFIVLKDELEEKRKHLPIVLLSRDGNEFYLGIKNARQGDPEIPTVTTAGHAEVTWDMKFLPAHWVATMLKVAHLTLFSMIGYKAVFDPSGDSFRRVLAQYYYDNAAREDAPNYFRLFLNAVKVVRTGTDITSPGATPMDLDTLRDRKVVCHYQRDRLFGVTLFYMLRDKTLSVTVPQSVAGNDIGTATRLYNRLMAEDPELNQTAILTRFENEGWSHEGKIGLHYEPVVPLVEKPHSQELA